MSSCLSIVIPTYNERENISTLIPLIHEVATKNNIDYEIIVVDDNSPDGTWLVAKELSKKYNVRVYVRYKEKGLASAIIYGAKRAKCENIIVMDADLQHPPEKIPEINNLLKSSCDIVVASRYTKGGGIIGWSKVRLLESVVATFLAKLFLPPARKTSDPLSGFFGVKKKLIFNPRIMPIGYKILLEILVKNPQAKVCDVPYIFRSRVKGKSKLGLKTISEYLIQLIKNIIYIYLKRS